MSKHIDAVTVQMIIVQTNGRNVHALIAKLQSIASKLGSLESNYYSHQNQFDLNVFFANDNKVIDFLQASLEEVPEAAIGLVERIHFCFET